MPPPDTVTHRSRQPFVLVSSTPTGNHVTVVRETGAKPASVRVSTSSRQPPEPHKLVPPEELDVEVQVADMMDGKLPHYCRPVPPELPLMPLGEDFERRLEAAKLGYDIGPDGELVPDVKIRRGKRSVA